MNKLTKEDLLRVVTRMPADVKKQVKERGLYLGGGFIREMVAGEEPRDIDLLGGDQQHLEDCANMLMANRKSDGQRCRSLKTKNAVTVVTPTRKTVQYIFRWLFDSPEKAVESFDFTVCQAVVFYDRESGKWDSHTHPDFYVDLAARRLVYTQPDRNEDAGGSMLRVRKFLHRGYHINADSLADVIARLAFAVRWEEVRDEENAARVLRGLLREVDPLLVVDGIDPIDEQEASLDEDPEGN